MPATKQCRLACLRSPHSSLATHIGATIEVEVARCTNCSSKLCLSFDPFQPRSLQQTRLHENYKFDHFHLLAYLPCCDRMSAHIFSNQRACRDGDKKTESHGCKAVELNPIAVPERCTAVFSLKSSFVLRLRGLLF